MIRIPESWKHRNTRADHSRFYMCIMWSLFISTMILFVAPEHVPLIVKLNPGYTHLLAGVLGLGTTFCITGFSMGQRFFFPRADLRTAYRMAIYATPSNVSALGMFALMMGEAARWDPILTIYSSASTLFIIAAHLWVAWDLHWEVQRIDARVKAAIARAGSDG